MQEIQTKKFKTVNEKTLIVTVDIGKVKNMGYCRCPDGKEIKPFEFSNNGHGFKKFWNCICQAKRAFHMEEIIVGFESTGSYGEPLTHYLRSRGVKLVQVNPLHTKKLKELEGNSPNKTDKKDPKVIADIMELGHTLTLVVPEGTAAELRRLTQARERSINRRSALWNQLQDLIFIIFPEFLEVMKDIKTKSAFHLIKHYPTPEAIVAYGLESLVLTLRKTSRGKLGKERAQALYEAARSSIGIKEGQESIILEIGEIISLIEESNRFIAYVEEQMSFYLKQIPYSRFIISMKGIGEITVAGLIGEVGDFSKFRTISEIRKLAGLDLFEISSGKHKGNRRISKRGRPLMRKLLYLATLNVVRRGGIMHEPYQRYLRRGMVKMKAIVAIMRKLLVVIFALVRDHSEYIVDYQERESLMKKVA